MTGLGISRQQGVQCIGRHVGQGRQGVLHQYRDRQEAYAPLKKR